jgi:Leucine-rich repeat (LRR) protein
MTPFHYLASFSNVTELNLSWNKLVTLPSWLLSFKKLVKLSLCGCDSLDFAALSTFLNGSSVTELDLSSCHVLMKSPEVVSSFIKSTKKVKILR